MSPYVTQSSEFSQSQTKTLEIEKYYSQLYTVTKIETFSLRNTLTKWQFSLN